MCYSLYREKWSFVNSLIPIYLYDAGLGRYQLLLFMSF
jgi:hypothetical protein